MPVVDLGPPRTYTPPIRPGEEPAYPDASTYGGGGDAYAWTPDLGPGSGSSECGDAGPTDVWRACECPGGAWLELVVGQHCIAYPRPGAECDQFFVRTIGHPDCIMNLVGDGVSTWRWTQPDPDAELYGADFRVSLSGAALVPDGQLAIVGPPGGEIWDWYLDLAWPSQERRETYLMKYAARHEAFRRLAVLVYERR